MDIGFQGTFFIFCDKWFVVSKIRDLRGRHTGYYCDIVTPLKRSQEGILEVTDLFLDLWVSPELEYKVLDEDEFEQAVKNGLVNEPLREKAQATLKQLMKKVENRRFPPPLVRHLEEKLHV